MNFNFESGGKLKDDRVGFDDSKIMEIPRTVQPLPPLPPIPPLPPAERAERTVTRSPAEQEARLTTMQEWFLAEWPDEDLSVPDMPFLRVASALGPG